MPELENFHLEACPRCGHIPMDVTEELFLVRHGQCRTCQLEEEK